MPNGKAPNPIGRLAEVSLSDQVDEVALMRNPGIRGLAKNTQRIAMLLGFTKLPIAGRYAMGRGATGAPAVAVLIAEHDKRALQYAFKA